MTVETLKDPYLAAPGCGDCPPPTQSETRPDNKTHAAKHASDSVEGSLLRGNVPAERFAFDELVQDA